MHKRKPYQDPDRYIPTPTERVANELAVIGGTAGILQGTLDLVNAAALRNGPDHPVGGYLFNAVKFIGKIDADGARMVAHHLFIVMDDIQTDQHPWTARYAIPFLQRLIRNSRESAFDMRLGL